MVEEGQVILQVEKEMEVQVVLVVEQRVLITVQEQQRVEQVIHLQ